MEDLSLLRGLSAEAFLKAWFEEPIGARDGMRARPLPSPHRSSAGPPKVSRPAPCRGSSCSLRPGGLA